MRALFSAAAVALLLPGSLGRVYNILNHCIQGINVYIDGKSQGRVPSGTSIVRNLPKDWSGYIYSDANGGRADGSNGTKAGFHGEGGYYYIVDEWRFNTGLRITPDSPIKNGFCKPALCDHKACVESIYPHNPTTFPPASNTPPQPPLYSCPGHDVGYQVTFCPFGGFPSPRDSPPAAIHPNGDKSKCIDLRGGVVANGTAIQIHDCNGSKGQQWLISAGTTVIGTFDNFAYNVNAGSANPRNGDKVMLWVFDDSTSSAETWIYTEDKRIQLYRTGKCLDLPNGSTANGNQLQIWDCIRGNTNQIWTIP
ncbi:Alpha-L-arabinofuranosidase [Termitomyces sp. T112]|nr:Alpha-L-arabinofuranosidase [Termitomyces sp. T112]